MDNTNSIRTSNLVFIVIWILLSLSVIFNIYLYIRSNDPILGSTHKVDKKITRLGVTWTGIHVQQHDAIRKVTNYNQRNYYELWRADRDGNSMLLDTVFFMNSYDKVTWETNRKDGINLNIYRGNTEGGVTTNIIYNYLGIEQLRIINIVYGTDSSFTFEQKEEPIYAVRPIIEGVCKRVVLDVDATIPEVTLKGVRLIKIIQNEIEKDFTLVRPVRVACGASPRKAITDPGIAVSKFDDESIEFILPNSQKGTIQLLGSEFPEVKFE